MIVLAIVAILTAMAGSTAQQIGARNATQNAASDLSSVLQSARARAEQRGTDVYVIVYPTATKSPWALTGGPGAIFVYEDTNGNFITGSGPCDGTGTIDCSWGSFAPPNVVSPSTSGDRFIQAIYLEDYPKKNVKFGKPTGAFGAPYGGIGALADTNGCSFCVAGNKGAIVFTGEQQLQFLNNAGAPMAQRVGGLALQAVDNPSRTFLFGLVAATGLVSVVR